MTKIIPAFLLATLTISVYGAQSRRVIASAGSPIPTSYSASNNQSLVLSELKTRDKRVMIIATMNSIACQEGESHTAAPTAQDGSVPNGVGLEKEFYLLASEPHYLDLSAKNIYCRSFSGAPATSGELYVHTN